MTPEHSCVDVAIVRHGGPLRDCLLSLCAQQQWIRRVFVLDNGDADSTADCTGLPFPVTCCRSENRGFGAGCNLLFQKTTAPFVLFFNPDALLPARGIEEPLRLLCANAQSGVCGCAMVHGWSKMNFPTLGALLLRGLSTKKLYRRFDQDVSGVADWVLGAYLLVRRDAFSKVRGFDENFFLYFEETDLCLRMKQAGYLTFYCATTPVGHTGGCSAGSVLKKARCHAKSRLLYAKKHLGPWAYAALFFSVHFLEPPLRLFSALRNRLSQQKRSDT